MNIILIGFKNAGKTTVGKLLATHFDSLFIDTDYLVEKLYSDKYGEIMTVKEIYVKYGEEYFRLLEQHIVFSLSQTKNAVIACGGGTPCNIDNADFLKSIGVMVYLDVRKDRLLSRIDLGSVHIKWGNTADLHANFEEMYCQRSKIYDVVADIHLEVDSETPDSVAEKIIKHIGDFING